MFYAALDGQGTLLPDMAVSRLSGIRGKSEELGNFRLLFPKIKTKQPIRYDHLVTYAPRLDRLKETVINAMRVEAWDKERTKAYFALGGRLVPRDSPGPNMIMHQVTIELPCEMEIIFESGSVENRQDTLSDEVFLKEY